MSACLLQLLITLFLSSQLQHEINVWNQFQPAINGRAKCNFCGQLINCSSGTTTGLRRHLNKHPHVVTQLREEAFESFQAAFMAPTKTTRSRLVTTEKCSLISLLVSISRNLFLVHPCSRHGIIYF